MSYVYNDAAMIIATQVAYLNFKGDNQNVGEVVDTLLSTYGVFENGGWQLKPEYDGGALPKAAQAQFDCAVNIFNLSNNAGGNDTWRNWQVVDVCDDQNDTGYYGVLIDTGDGNAIIGNRGSESIDFMTGYKDWGEADIGLLDSELTKQQQRAEKYMEKLWYKYGDQYDSYSVTGHSLGGNLAEHMTITAPEAMRSRIDHCASFDGPGFSDEYIQKHRKEIEKMAPAIDHYQWSWVSSLLNPLPGVKDTVIKAHNDEESNGILSMLWRHHTRNVEFDDDGYIQEGDESFLSQILGPLSRDIDNATLLDLLLEVLDREPDLYTFIMYGLKLLAHAISSFRDVVQKCEEVWANIYYDYLAPRVSGEYEINMASASGLKEELNRVNSQIQSIDEEIDYIRRTLQYWSASGSYYKSKMFFIQNGLKSDGKHLSKMSAVLEKAINCYNMADRQAAALFS